MTTLEAIFKAYGLEVEKIEPIDIGLINQSFKLSTLSGNFFLQKINDEVFKDIDGMMNNIDLVTKHLKSRVNEDILSVPMLIKTLTNGLYFKDEDDAYWRLYEMIEESHSFNTIPNTSIAYESGKILATFIASLSDFNSALLVETIPNFDNLKVRLENYFDSLTQDTYTRASEAQNEIAFIQQFHQQVSDFNTFLKSDAIIKRVTHNDTKINNILFDKNNKAIALIDFDTLMRGTVLFDFGDAMRSGLNNVLEDEEDLSKLKIDLEIFKAYATGFLTHIGLTQNEKDNLLNAILFVTFMLGVRFLSDFLEGDRYFHTSYPTQNLVRAKVQFKLFEILKSKQNKMALILKNIV